MTLFFVGFWCGCLTIVLVICLMNRSEKRQSENETGDRIREKKEKKVSSTVAKGAGLRVLLVDDSKLSRTVIKEFLAKREVEIFEAESGSECLKLARDKEFDLIFMDQTMPGMNGDETLQRLWKNCGVKQEVPVIAMGSALRKANEEEFKTKGYVACLGKPIQENRLEEILSQVFPVDRMSEKQSEKQPEKKSEVPEGFSYQKGLGNFDGDETVYRETLVLFSEIWEERKEALRQFLAEENMAEYAILIHAIKGDARTLGAIALGEAAYEQEMKAKSGDVEAIRTGFARVIEMGNETTEYFLRNFS